MRESATWDAYPEEQLRAWHNIDIVVTTEDGQEHPYVAFEAMENPQTGSLLIQRLVLFSIKVADDEEPEEVPQLFPVAMFPKGARYEKRGLVFDKVAMAEQIEARRGAEEQARQAAAAAVLTQPGPVPIGPPRAMRRR